MAGKIATAAVIGLLGLLLVVYAIDLFREAWAERAAAASAPAGTPAPATPPPSAAQHVPIEGVEGEPEGEGEGAGLDGEPVIGDE